MVDLFFREFGSGQAVILLHGFPFHQGIWQSFAEKLSASAHVYTVDLPGFGKSAALKAPFTIDQTGEVIVSWIKEKKLENPILIGHSLGGYVTLAAAKKNPELFSGLGLFHSTAYPDTEEKKQSRNKVLDFISKNGVEAFTSNFIGPLFANPDHPSTPLIKAIAMEATAETVKGYTQAMRDRIDRTDVLRSFFGPVLFLAGEQDPGISVESIRRQAALSHQPDTHVLSHTAHMGMFEKEEESLGIIRAFIQKRTVTRKSGTV